METAVKTIAFRQEGPDGGPFNMHLSSYGNAWKFREKAIERNTIIKEMREQGNPVVPERRRERD